MSTKAYGLNHTLAQESIILIRFCEEQYASAEARNKGLFGGDVALKDNIRKHRERNRKSLQELADAVGASKAHIWELETGRAKNPSIELLMKLAKTFDVSVSDLIDENPGAPDDSPELVALYRELKELSDADRKAIQNIMDHFRKRER
jgi:transcriptional regulator with XRE-family HTH domain